jgi:hypothetical protein
VFFVPIIDEESKQRRFRRPQLNELLQTRSEIDVPQHPVGRLFCFLSYTRLVLNIDCCLE